LTGRRVKVVLRAFAPPLGKENMFPLRDSVPTRSVPVVTRTLILINVLVFFIELALPQEALEQVFYLFGIVSARFTHPDWAASVGFPVDTYWPLLTHQFLHGGWLHIISNMWTLWIFGDNVEDRMGPVRFGMFYLLCGVLAGLTQLLSSPHSTMPSVGASGAIAGVLGAYFLLFPTARLVVMIPILFFPFFFEIPAVLYLGVWFLSQLFSGTLALASPERVGGIAWWAHIGGFAGGMLLFRLFVRRQRRLQSDEHRIEWAGHPPRRR
jgi:membrane associated rhomboid family serine protease